MSIDRVKQQIKMSCGELIWYRKTLYDARYTTECPAGEALQLDQQLSEGDIRRDQWHCWNIRDMTSVPLVLCGN